MTVRRATDDDVPRIAAVLAHAFAADPPMRWVTGASPRAERRLRSYFSALVPRLHMAARRGLGLRRPVGAAALGGARRVAAAALARAGADPGAAAHLRPPSAAALAGAPRRTGDDHPAEPHWFLDYIGVEAAARGRGTGSALMRPVLERCDAEGVGAFLNAGSERSRDLYARHGFEVTGASSSRRRAAAVADVARARASARAAYLQLLVSSLAGPPLQRSRPGPPTRESLLRFPKSWSSPFAALLDVARPRRRSRCRRRRPR